MLTDSLHGKWHDPGMDDKKETGRRIRGLRNEHGWTLQDLSRETGGALSKSRISNYEQGLRGIGVYEARLLARALGTTAAYLLLIEPEDYLPPDERTLLQKYRASDDRGKKSIQSVADAQPAQENLDKNQAG